MTTKNLFIIPLQVHANQDNLKAALAFKKQYYETEILYYSSTTRRFWTKIPSHAFFLSCFPRLWQTSTIFKFPFKY